MKTINAYSIVDRLSDSVITVFYSPNLRMARKSFDNFCADMVKKSGDKNIVNDFELYQSLDIVSIPETTTEVDNMKLVYCCSGVLEGDENEVVSNL